MQLSNIMLTTKRRNAEFLSARDRVNLVDYPLEMS